MHNKQFNRRRHPTPEVPPTRRGRFWWPGLLLFLLTTRVAAQDSARYQVSWTIPSVDATHPAATFYHWQLILGDTVSRQPLTFAKAIGMTWGYTGVYASRYGYPTLPTATVTIGRPAIDSLGPFRIVVQAAYILPDSTWVLGPYTWTAAWWVPHTGVPLVVGVAVPGPVLGYAIQGVPWP